MRSLCAVEAPDAFAAFILTHGIGRLGHDVDVEPCGERFCVEFEADYDELARALRVVQHWLLDERIEATTVRFGARSEVLRAA